MPEIECPVGADSVSMSRQANTIICVIEVEFCVSNHVTLEISKLLCTHCE